MLNKNQQDKLTSLEDLIRKSDDDGIKARWESGRFMLKLRGRGTRLPNGMRETLEKGLGISGWEQSKRMMFAEQVSEQELCEVVTQLKSWRRIVNEKLVTKKKGAVTKPSPATRLATAMEEFEPMGLAEDERDRLKRAAERLLGRLSHFDELDAVA